jgi:hypothetical protein
MNKRKINKDLCYRVKKKKKRVRSWRCTQGLELSWKNSGRVYGATCVGYLKAELREAFRSISKGVNLGIRDQGNIGGLYQK